MSLKKILATVLTGVCMFSVIGCSNNSNGGNGSADAPDKQPSVSFATRVDMANVEFTEGELAERYAWNDSYVKHLDSDRLLYWYRDSNDVTQPAGCEPYPDWENSKIWNGITLGHYITALSMLYRNSGDAWYKEKVDYVIAELEPCQHENGLIFAYEEARFDELENGGDVQKYGPNYYYVAKTLMGLNYAYSYCGNEKALEMAKKLGDWIYWRTNRSIENGTRMTMLNNEYGDIGNSLYDLYNITLNENYKTAAEYFNEEWLLNGWAENKVNILNVHSNTTIPKASAFVRAYALNNDEKYLVAAENFWTEVITKYTYPNGGCSSGEGFRPVYLGTITPGYPPCETCTIYNMIRLSQYLYEVTDDVKYIDFIERAALNGIMGSINEQGCKTYYQDMAPDGHRAYHALDGGFWCCTGTGMENFQRLLSTVGYEREGGFDINVFVSAKVKTESGVEFEIINDDENNTIKILKGGKTTLRFRIPDWCSSYGLMLDGKPLGKEDGRYIVVDRTFTAGEEITYFTGFKTQIEWSDYTDAFTLRYGPYQMVSLYESTTMIPGTVGEGWMANPKIERLSGKYYIALDNETLLLEKYGAITTQKFTTYFIRIDG